MKGEFLGVYKVSPNVKEIEVDCYGTIYPAQRQTLEQEGIVAHSELETVIHNEVDITYYLSDDLLDELSIKINQK